ncbi:UNVERIFIED_CONTAM: hypothetical protein Scaly_2937300 [Sesamum calycinum]|uniref:RNase H type-1 domain-containing protein n=1 Tax=Sesamum calycinum TaxID=2727403 RepID=A0AAW2KTV1_9LAMI
MVRHGARRARRKPRRWASSWQWKGAPFARSAQSPVFLNKEVVAEGGYRGRVDETQLQYLVHVSIGLSMPYLEVLDLERFGPTLKSWFHSRQSYAQPNSIDGSSLGNPGLAGAAGIIRDSARHVHLAYQFALGTGTSVLAELTAVWRVMELALTYGLAPLVVEVHATTVISLLKSRASGKWEVQHLIMRIVRLQQLLVADVQHVFREANGAVDHLVKEAASLQLIRVLHHDDITGVLCSILCFD